MRDPRFQLAGVAFAVAFLTVCVVPSAHAAFSATGDMYLAASATIIDRTKGEGTENSDAGYVEGTDGNSATGLYLVSLDQGALASYLGADAGELPPGGVHYQSAQGTTDLDLVENFRFLIPAGDYPGGVTAYLGVRIRGTVQPTAGSNLPYGSATVAVNILGEDSIVQFHGPINSSDPPIFVDDSIELQMDLLIPITLPSDWVEWRSLIATLETTAGTGSFLTEPGDSVTSFIVNFEYLEVSDPRVSWTSESGVFTVPEPSRWLLLAAGMSLLVLLQRVSRRG